QSFDFASQHRVAQFRSHPWVILADHGDARRRRYADDFGPTEDIYKMAHEGNSILIVPGVVVHLAAAGLFSTKLHGMAQPLQYANHSFAGFRKQQIVITSDKQRNS